MEIHIGPKGEAMKIYRLVLTCFFVSLSVPFMMAGDDAAEIQKHAEGARLALSQNDLPRAE